MYANALSQLFLRIMLAITVAPSFCVTQNKRVLLFFLLFSLSRCYKTSRPITLDLYVSYHAQINTTLRSPRRRRERANKKKSK